MCNIPCVCAVHAMVLCMVTGAAALPGPRELSVVANYRLGSNNNIILRWSPPPVLARDIESYDVQVRALDGAILPTTKNLPHGRDAEDAPVQWVDLAGAEDLSSKSGYDHPKSGMPSGSFHAVYELRVATSSVDSSKRYSLAMDASGRQGAGGSLAADANRRSVSEWISGSASASEVQNAVQGLAGVQEARVEMFDLGGLEGVGYAGARAYRISLAYDLDHGVGSIGPVGASDLGQNAPQLRVSQSQGFPALPLREPAVMVRRLRRAALPFDAASTFAAARLLCGEGGITSVFDSRLARAGDPRNVSAHAVQAMSLASYGTRTPESMGRECLIVVPMELLASGARHQFRVRTRYVLSYDRQWTGNTADSTSEVGDWSAPSAPVLAVEARLELPPPSAPHRVSSSATSMVVAVGVSPGAMRVLRDVEDAVRSATGSATRFQLSTVPTWLQRSGGLSSVRVQFQLRHISGRNVGPWRLIGGNFMLLSGTGVTGKGTASAIIQPLLPGASYEARARLVSPIAGISPWSTNAAGLRTSPGLPPAPVLLWPRLPGLRLRSVANAMESDVSQTSVFLRWSLPEMWENSSMVFDLQTRERGNKWIDAASSITGTVSTDVVSTPFEQARSPVIGTRSVGARQTFQIASNVAGGTFRILLRGIVSALSNTTGESEPLEYGTTRSLDFEGPGGSIVTRSMVWSATAAEVQRTIRAAVAEARAALVRVSGSSSFTSERLWASGPGAVTVTKSSDSQLYLSQYGIEWPSSAGPVPLIGIDAAGLRSKSGESYNTERHRYPWATSSSSRLWRLADEHSSRTSSQETLRRFRVENLRPGSNYQFRIRSRTGHEGDLSIGEWSLGSPVVRTGFSSVAQDGASLATSQAERGGAQGTGSGGVGLSLSTKAFFAASVGTADAVVMWQHATLLAVERSAGQLQGVFSRTGSSSIASGVFASEAGWVQQVQFGAGAAARASGFMTWPPNLLASSSKARSAAQSRLLSAFERATALESATESVAGASFVAVPAPLPPGGVIAAAFGSRAARSGSPFHEPSIGEGGLLARDSGGAGLVVVRALGDQGAIVLPSVGRDDGTTGRHAVFRFENGEGDASSSLQVLALPRGTRAVEIRAWGGGGGSGCGIIGSGGGGAYAQGTFAAQADDIVAVAVGGGGGTCNGGSPGLGGWGGGSNGGEGTKGGGGGGGGASWVYLASGHNSVVSRARRSVARESHVTPVHGHSSILEGLQSPQTQQKGQQGRQPAFEGPWLLLVASGGGGGGAADLCCGHGGAGASSSPWLASVSDEQELSAGRFTGSIRGALVQSTAPVSGIHGGAGDAPTADILIGTSHGDLGRLYPGADSHRQLNVSDETGESTLPSDMRTLAASGGAGGTLHRGGSGGEGLRTSDGAFLTARRGSSGFHGKFGFGGRGGSGFDGGGGGGGGLYGGGGGGAGIDGGGGGSGSSFLASSKCVAAQFNRADSIPALRSPPRVVAATSAEIVLAWPTIGQQGTGAPGAGGGQGASQYVIEVSAGGAASAAAAASGYDGTKISDVRGEEGVWSELARVPSEQLDKSSSSLAIDGSYIGAIRRGWAVARIHGLLPGSEVRLRVRAVSWHGGMGPPSKSVQLLIPLSVQNGWQRIEAVTALSVRNGVRDSSRGSEEAHGNGKPPAARRGASLTEVTGRQFLFGGLMTGTSCSNAGLSAPCVAGAGLSNELWVLDPITQAWSLVSAAPDAQHGYPAPREGHLAASIGGSLHVWSGRSQSMHRGAALSTFATDVWRLDTGSERLYTPSDTADHPSEVADGNVKLDLPLYVDTVVDTSRGVSVRAAQSVSRAWNALRWSSIQPDLVGVRNTLMYAATGDASSSGLDLPVSLNVESRAKDLRHEGECVASVRVWVEIRHGCRNDLRIELIGPQRAPALSGVAERWLNSLGGVGKGVSSGGGDIHPSRQQRVLLYDGSTVSLAESDECSARFAGSNATNRSNAPPSDAIDWDEQWPWWALGGVAAQAEHSASKDQGSKRSSAFGGAGPGGWRWAPPQSTEPDLSGGSTIPMFGARMLVFQDEASDIMQQDVGFVYPAPPVASRCTGTGDCNSDALGATARSRSASTFARNYDAQDYSTASAEPSFSGASESSPWIVGRQAPVEALSAFEGRIASGEWRLRVQDARRNGVSGAVRRWGLVMHTGPCSPRPRWHRLRDDTATSGSSPLPPLPGQELRPEAAGVDSQLDQASARHGPPGRTGASGVVIGSSWFVAGGFGTGSHEDLWRFDAEDAVWNRLRPSPRGASYGAYSMAGSPSGLGHRPHGRRAVLSPWGVLATGGRDPSGGSAARGTGSALPLVVWRQDPASGRWTAMSSRSAEARLSQYDSTATAAAAGRAIRRTDGGASASSPATTGWSASQRGRGQISSQWWQGRLSHSIDASLGLRSTVAAVATSDAIYEGGGHGRIPETVRSPTMGYGGFGTAWGGALETESSYTLTQDSSGAWARARAASSRVASLPPSRSHHAIALIGVHGSPSARRGVSAPQLLVLGGESSSTARPLSDAWALSIRHVPYASPIGGDTGRVHRGPPEGSINAGSPHLPMRGSGGTVDRSIVDRASTWSGPDASGVSAQAGSVGPRHLARSAAGAGGTEPAGPMLAPSVPLVPTVGQELSAESVFPGQAYSGFPGPGNLKDEQTEHLEPWEGPAGWWSAECPWRLAAGSTSDLLWRGSCMAGRASTSSGEASDAAMRLGISRTSGLSNGSQATNFTASAQRWVVGGPSAPSQVAASCDFQELLVRAMCLGYWQPLGDL